VLLSLAGGCAGARIDTAVEASEASALDTVALGAPERAAGPLRVACLGDSITFGSAFPKGADRENGCYPAQLGAMLGPGYEVRNFGVGGATLLSAADTPLTATRTWDEALAWEPDIAVVLLGTNDSCDGPGRPNW